MYYLMSHILMHKYIFHLENKNVAVQNFARKKKIKIDCQDKNIPDSKIRRIRMIKIGRNIIFHKLCIFATQWHRP